MHKLTYQGNKQYMCSSCGEEVAREDVTKFLKTSCSGQDNLVKINKKIAALDQRIVQLERAPVPPGTD